MLKARYLFDLTGEPSFADDTGLLVDSLDGAPGVFSARYAGPDKDDRENIQKLLREMGGKDNREARFVTIIAFVDDSGEYFFEGEVEGTIGLECKGSGGFGYDPVFIPAGHSRTFAEMSPAEKNSMSHRGKAVEKLVDFLKNHAS